MQQQQPTILKDAPVGVVGVLKGWQKSLTHKIQMQKASTQIQTILDNAWEVSNRYEPLTAELLEELRLLNKRFMDDEQIDMQWIIEEKNKLI